MAMGNIKKSFESARIIHEERLKEQEVPYLNLEVGTVGMTIDQGFGSRKRRPV